MEIQTVQNQQKWESWRGKIPLASFLQSWAWGEFQASQGHRIFRHALCEGDDCFVLAQWIETAKQGSFTYWFAPRGPLSTVELKDPHYVEVMKKFLFDSPRYGAKVTPLFLRIEPPIESCYESTCLVLKTDVGMRNIPAIHPADTRILKLEQDEGMLLAAMHQKTRYNIRLAEKKGVEVARDLAFVEDFIRLNYETTERDGFHSHADDYYRDMVNRLPGNMIDVYGARYQGKVIAANIVIHDGLITTYLHGASSSEDRSVMAPYALQWRQIQDACKRGDTRYDFWGIAPSSRPSPKAQAWAGITRFKNGFGGVEKNYVGTFDLPIRKLWYSLYSVVQSLRG